MALALLLLSLCLLPWTAQAACVVRPAATVPLTVVDGTILVTVEVNRIAANFVLDTGAQRSVVTDAAVKRLALARDEWVGTTMHGLGGIESRPNADPRSISLGGVPLVRPVLSHDNSLTVGVLARTEVGNTVIDGLLGRDFLSAFDLDLDVPKRRLTLYHVSDCGGRFLPWHANYTAIPVTMPAGRAIVLPVALDGVPLRAMLDSGADGSLLGAAGIYRLGLQPAALANDPADSVSGLGPRAVVMRRHAFRTLRVGDQTIADPTIWIAPIRLAPIVDMLLGADWLAGRRVWISFTTGQLFVATTS